MLHLLPLYKENIVQQSGELNAFNHMAILLRWLIEHDMMSDEFASKYDYVIKNVKTSPESIDLRKFIIDNLIGTLRYDILNDDIIEFVSSYCLNNPDEEIIGQYYDDIADYAVKYFENVKAQIKAEEERQKAEEHRKQADEHRRKAKQKREGN